MGEDLSNDSQHRQCGEDSTLHKYVWETAYLIVELDNQFLDLVAHNQSPSQIIVGSINMERTGWANTLKHAQCDKV